MPFSPTDILGHLATTLRRAETELREMADADLTAQLRTRADGAGLAADLVSTVGDLIDMIIVPTGAGDPDEATAAEETSGRLPLPPVGWINIITETDGTFTAVARVVAIGAPSTTPEAALVSLMDAARVRYKNLRATPSGQLSEEDTNAYQVLLRWFGDH